MPFICRKLDLCLYTLQISYQIASNQTVNSTCSTKRVKKKQIELRFLSFIYLIYNILIPKVCYHIQTKQFQQVSSV